MHGQVPSVDYIPVHGHVLAEMCISLACARMCSANNCACYHILSVGTVLLHSLSSL